MRFFRRRPSRSIEKVKHIHKYHITLYCPDDHIAYNGNTPDKQGIGGGITARVRVLKALAQAGHDVTAFVHCDQPGMYGGVRYEHFSGVHHIHTDIFIATTSGGRLSFEPLRKVRVDARLRIVWVHGTQKPKGLDVVQPNVIYTPSNFIRVVALQDWKVPSHRLFVTYNGIEEQLFQQAPRHSARDPYALLYLGYPGKGLHYALNVLHRLRQQNAHFHLDVYGDYNLWGQDQALKSPPAGVRFHGTIPQRDLIPRLFRYSFLLALQDFEEPFGISIIEAKRAGVIPVASAVGALPEIIRPGVDGILISQRPELERAQSNAVENILELLASPERLACMRDMAARLPWTWKRVAATWIQHWDRTLYTPKDEDGLPDKGTARRCMCCGQYMTEYADGWRCDSCGCFAPDWGQ